ncbi:MAG: hypothetical protein GWO81_07910 [Verrucomicrobia bacterium]|nr:hypothetical protein [Verrucomicrobiota bacterium]
MLDFFKCIDLKDTSVKDAQFFFWRKLPSIAKPVNLCPECDVMIATPDTITVIFCFWNVTFDESKTNLVKERIQKISEFIGDEKKLDLSKRRELNLLLIDHSEKIQTKLLPTQLNCRLLKTTWKKLCTFKSHPHSEEIERYCRWKCKHTRPTQVEENQVA